MTVISRQQMFPMGQLGQECHQQLVCSRGAPGKGGHHQVGVSSLNSDPLDGICPFLIPRADLYPLPNPL